MRVNFQQLKELVKIADHQGYFDWASRLQVQIDRLEKIHQQVTA